MNMRMRNKVAGAIYGFAIGDAMGATTEFMTAEQINKVHGKVTDIIGGGWLDLEPGEITDDTQMTLCVMSAIMSKPENTDQFIAHCEKNFILWKCSKPKDIGAQCARAINDLMFGRKAPIDKQALGNGSLMRAMPLAVLDLPFWNMMQGRITHNNKVCSDIILGYSGLIQDYMNDKVTSKYTKGVKDLLEPTGYIVNTFNNSVYWSRKDSFEEAIVGAVNHGGDADTIAAITGSLAGAKFGYSEIPEKWINQLNSDVKENLEKFQHFVFSCLQI